MDPNSPKVEANEPVNDKTSLRRRSLGSFDRGDAESIALADTQLSHLGYVAELTRTRSTWHVAFMSFVISTVPYGLSTTMYYPLIGGGPVAMIWGWVTVSIISMCVAISLGEITSVYPTAGGVYYQTYILSPERYRNITAWICGWAYVLGNITITLSVSFGTTQFFLGCINIFVNDEGVGIFPYEAYQVFLVFVGITLLQNLVSALGNSWLPKLDGFSMIFTFLAVFAIGISVLVVARNGRNSASYVFTSFQPSSGWPSGWSFCIGLLHAAYVFSGTGMILSMCEEVQQPATQVPHAMVITIILNSICGLLFYIPLLFVLPPIEEVLASPSGQPLPVILLSAIGNAGGAYVLTLPILIIAIICGIGCTTAASRATWAFARDGAIPGSNWLRHVNHKLELPFNAMMFSMVIQLALGAIYFGSTAAFNAFSGVGVIFLTISYTMPIIMSLFNRRTALATGQFNLGAFGAVCNVVAIAWCLLVTPLFSMPAAIPTTATTMNYASAVFVFGVAASAIWYFTWGRRHYQGPLIQIASLPQTREG